MTPEKALLNAIGTRSRSGVRSVEWFGRKVATLESPVAAEVLARVLYRHAYSAGAPEPWSPAPGGAADPAWALVPADPRLSAWWSGWEAEGINAVRQAGQPVLTLNRWPGLGVDGSISLSPQSTTALPGWLLIRHGDVRQGRNEYRVYLNTEPEAAIQGVGAVVTLLLSTYQHFAAKLLTSSDHRRRADSTVLYLPARPTREFLVRLKAVSERMLHSPAVPMFTERVSAGIAVAPSPPGGDSFGTVLCRAVAQSLIDTFRAGDTPTEAAIQATITAVKPRRSGPRVTLRSDEPAAEAGDRDAVCEATRALQELVDELHRTAVAVDGAALWFASSAGGAYRRLGAGVYAGAAGPLAALAHAERLGGSLPTRRLLQAAARSMLTAQTELPAHGFHEGRFGTAAVLAEAAALSGDDEVRSIALLSLRAALESVQEPGGWDVVSGIAGSILALNCATTLLDVEPVTSAITALSSRLVLFASPGRRHTLQWRPTAAAGGKRALAGLAHGGTGAAVALAVAGTLSDTPADVQDQVLRTVSFEDTYRRDEEGWLDFRLPRVSHATAWCHGSGGIAVGTAALLRSWPESSPGTDTLRDRAHLALDNTARAIAEPQDRCLCHGASGRALAVRIMRDVLSMPADSPSDRSRARRVIATIGKGDTSLMTGSTGCVIAALALTDLAPMPVAVSLLPDTRTHIGGSRRPQPIK
jgi:hypothetical protein